MHEVWHSLLRGHLSTAQKNVEEGEEEERRTRKHTHGFEPCCSKTYTHTLQPNMFQLPFFYQPASNSSCKLHAKQHIRSYSSPESSAASSWHRLCRAASCLVSASLRMKFLGNLLSSRVCPYALSCLLPCAKGAAFMQCRCIPSVRIYGQKK